MFPVAFRADVEIDPGSCRQNRSGAIAMNPGAELVAGRADIGINAEQFLENDHGRCG